ncbi:GLUG motif-containing protein [Burkholderia semiarida]|uniref:GLUG motif-containing protein n=1 Tax=Burkholderia semiarida TaxID=2843303 RepID=A0ABW7L7Z3_9BURK
MNKAYALVWNQANGCWSVAGENARRRGKAGGRRVIAAAVSLLGFAASSAYALPTGAEIVSGKGDFATSADNKTMSINQHTDKLITNWQDFSVAGGERVSFNQPTNQSLALNRVVGANGSNIEGRIDANGKVFLVNPNGVLFGSGAQVNVGGLVASTRDISDKDFLNGNFRFNGKSAGQVVNQGTITAADGGGVALLGAQVTNNGVIRAQMGTVALGAGNDVKVNFDGSKLLSLEVNGAAVDALVSNGGLLKADGGQVLMSARSANSLLDTVVNNSGTIEAKGLNNVAGRITLDGGDGAVQVAGTLDASTLAGAEGHGAVVTKGAAVRVADTAAVDTRGHDGVAGKWTIESANAGVGRSAASRALVIGGQQVGGSGGSDAAIGADTLARNLGTTNVELARTTGTLKVDAPVIWSSDNGLTLTSRQGDVELHGPVTATGDNAGVTVNAARQIRVNDKLTLNGQNAKLELNPGSGLAVNGEGAVTLSGANASYRSNGEAYRVINSVDELRSIDNDLSGRYVLGSAVDGGGRQFRSIGNDYTFIGKFDGLGNTISNLSVFGTGPYIGLFSVNAGYIGNLKLASVNVTGARSYTGNGHALIGGLAGVNMDSGIISNVRATNVTVNAGTLSRMQTLGGLVGSNLGGDIDRSSVTGRIVGNRSTLAMGGLVGESYTIRGNPKKLAMISNSSADMAISGGIADQGWFYGGVGGLVGVNRGGAISNSSSAGSITLAQANAKVGGLVGVNSVNGDVGTGAIQNSSSSVNVSVSGGNGSIGGLVGDNDVGTSIANSSASGTVRGAGNSTIGGLIGVNRGSLSNVSASGAVNGTASGSTIGGLIGRHLLGTVANGTATGNVSGVGSAAIGGLVGVNESVLTNGTATGDVTDKSAALIGGLVGQNKGQITVGVARGDVTSGGASHVGGLVGNNDKGTISGSDAYGQVTGGAFSLAGGLVGVNTGAISGSQAKGDVSADMKSTVGGLVGMNGGTIANSKASGKVVAGASASVGGLVGKNANGDISNSKAIGMVEGGNSAYAGGLVGHNDGRVSNSEASGAVTAGASSTVGGLVGMGDVAGRVAGSKATGDVTGGNYASVGGLIGTNGSLVSDSESSGTVSAGRGARLGGLVGYNVATVKDSKTSSRINYVSGYDQIYGGLVGLNYGRIQTTVATGPAAEVQRIGGGITR